MAVKLTDLGSTPGSDPKPLSPDIRLVGDSFTIDWQIVEVSENGQTKLRRKASQRPIRIVLEQCLGLDQTLFQLAKRTAGFSIMITHTIDSQGADGVIEETPILDVTLKDLVPDDLVIGPMLSLHLVTKTEPQFPVSNGADGNVSKGSP